MVKIDIPMPKSCEDCPIYYDGYCCPLPHAPLPDEYARVWNHNGKDSEERMPTCPLIEVKDDD